VWSMSQQTKGGRGGGGGMGFASSCTLYDSEGIYLLLDTMQSGNG